MHTVDVHLTIFTSLLNVTLKKNCVTEFFILRDPRFFSTNGNIGVASGGRHPVPDPDGSLGGPQPLGHWVDPHLQLTN